MELRCHRFIQIVVSLNRVDARLSEPSAEAQTEMWSPAFPSCIIHGNGVPFIRFEQSSVLLYLFLVTDLYAVEAISFLRIQPYIVAFVFLLRLCT